MATAHGVVGSDFCSLTGDSNTVITNVSRRIPNHNHVTSSRYIINVEFEVILEIFEVIGLRWLCQTDGNGDTDYFI